MEKFNLVGVKNHGGLGIIKTATKDKKYSIEWLVEPEGEAYNAWWLEDELELRVDETLKLNQIVLDFMNK
jgi:hypothetical protein